MSARNQRRRSAQPPEFAPRGNVRFPSAKGRQRLESRNVAGTSEAVIFIPVTWLNTVIALMLLPLVWVTTKAFFATASHVSAAGPVWKSTPVMLFGWGVAVWLAAFWAGLRPRYLYVLGHELTHAFFVILHGGRIHDFHVTAEGGHVVTDKNNVLISLSPYFVPFWSLVAVGAFGLAGLAVDLESVRHWVVGRLAFDLRPEALLFFFLGYTWGLHLTFTLWMVMRDQPDLKQNGTFFSLVFIFFVNLLLISGLMIAASPSLTLGQFADEWLNALRSVVRAVRATL